MRTKLIVMALAALVVCATAAQADVYAYWHASGGFYKADGTTPLLTGQTSGLSTLAQLIWSLNNIADSAAPGGAVTGDDVLLANFTVTEDGINNPATLDDYAVFDAPIFHDFGARPDGGYIYARIFQDPTVDAGDWYYVSDVVAASDLNPSDVPPPSPQNLELNGDPVFGNDINENWTGSNDGHDGEQVVPEPGTIGLFALGAALIGLRRRRK
jgi:hypothetical protein